MKSQENLLPFPSSGPPEPCPDCGISQMTITTEEYRFPYGSGNESVELSARLPIKRCQNCQFMFLDATAQMLRHEAVCRHLGLLSPSEITALRTRYGLNRVEFSRLTKIGEASLTRWESGHLIQNSANDQLLYLLTFPENLDRLRLRADPDCGEAAKAPQFRAIEPRTYARSASDFRLRIAR